MSAASMNRVPACSAMAMAGLLGGGALLAFYAFLIAGPFALVRLDLSETWLLFMDAVLSLLFFVQHSGMVRQSFRAWLAQTVPRAYHPATCSDRLLFNVLWTSWIVLGSYPEERNLVAEFGERYQAYQQTVPMLLPWRGKTGRTL